MVNGLWFMVYGLWFMVYGLWFTVYCLWFMVYGLWYLVYGLWYIGFDDLRLATQGICSLRIVDFGFMVQGSSPVVRD
jgi:hypothetical protein